MSARPRGRLPRCCRTWSRARRRGGATCPWRCSSSARRSLLVGFARPQASIRVKRQDATVILVLDVSGSMAARDSNPTRLGAARAAAQRYVDKLPKGYRMAVVTFSDHTTLAAAPTHDVSLVRAAINRAHTGPQGTALADAVSRAVTIGRSVPADEGQAAARRDRRLLRRWPDRGTRHAAAGREAGGERSHPGHGGRRRHARRDRAAAAQGRLHGAHPGPGAADGAAVDRDGKRRPVSSTEWLRSTSSPRTPTSARALGTHTRRSR